MRTAICNNHDEILDAVRKIYLESRAIQNSDGVDEMHRYAAEIERWASDIEDAAFYAKESGQAMENRLSEYYHAIEDLGFVRRKQEK